MSKDQLYCFRARSIGCTINDGNFIMSENITASKHSGISDKTRAAAEKYKNIPDDVSPALEADPDRPTGEAPTRFGDWEKKGRCIDF